MATEPPIDLAGYLASHLGAPVKILFCKQSFPGASRETWLIRAEVGGRAEGFALRVDPPSGPAVPFSLKREYEVYRALFKTEVPVAEPLWFAEGVAFAEGRPHMVRRLAEGSTAIPGLTDATAAGAALRRTVTFEMAEKLAMVHLLDWRALGLGELLSPPPSAAEALRAEFAQWVGIWDETRPYADPIMDEAICWLSENVPDDTPRVSLLKGNNGIGEEIWQDGRIVAMSDWELASLGDGTGDLQFSQGTLQMGNYDEVIAHYERCVGSPVSPRRMAFSAFLVWFKQLVCLRSYMFRPYMEGRDKRLTGLSFGLVFAEAPYGRLASCIGRDLVSAWHDLIADERAIYTDFSGGKK